MKNFASTMRYLPLALALALPLALFAGQEETSAKKPDSTKVKLLEATRADTEAAGRAAAKDAAKPAEDESKTNAATSKTDKQESEVTELTPKSKSSLDSKDEVKLPEEKSKSPLKKIHGSVYGTSGVAGRTTGGSVGATSKNGNTSVYVESERSHVDAGSPH